MAQFWPKFCLGTLKPDSSPLRGSFWVTWSTWSTWRGAVRVNVRVRVRANPRIDSSRSASLRASGFAAPRLAPALLTSPLWPSPFTLTLTQLKQGPKSLIYLRSLPNGPSFPLQHWNGSFWVTCRGVVFQKSTPRAPLRSAARPGVGDLDLVTLTSHFDLTLT